MAEELVGHEASKKCQRDIASVIAIDGRSMPSRGPSVGGPRAPAYRGPSLLRYGSERSALDDVTVAVSGDSVVLGAGGGAGVRYPVGRIFRDHGTAEQYGRVGADADTGAIAADFVTVRRHSNGPRRGGRNNTVGGIVVGDAVGNRHGRGATGSPRQIDRHPDGIIGSNDVIDCAGCRR
jgi:hypothetical protein